MGICPEKGVAVNLTGQLSQQLRERAWVRWLVKRAWAGHQNQFWVTRHKNHSNPSTGSLISAFPEIMPHYIFLATHLIGEESKAKTKSKIVLHVQGTVTKDGVQPTVTLFQHSASLLEYVTVTDTANSISCPTIRHTVQSSSVTNRWHQKHPHLFQLIYALRIYCLKCQLPSPQISHVEKTLIALNPTPNSVTYSFPFAIWPLSWKVIWMWKKK